MVIFQYNLYIFGIHLWTVLYPKPCYNEPCYKEVVVYIFYKSILNQWSVGFTKPMIDWNSGRFPTLDYPVWTQHTLQPLYNRVCYRYSLESASKEYPQCIFQWRNMKNIMWIAPLIYFSTEVTKIDIQVRHFFNVKYWYFFLFHMNSYVVCTH